MTKTKSILSVIALLLLAALALLVPISASGSASGESVSIELTSDGDMTDIVKDGKSSYAVIYAPTDELLSDADFAFELRNLIFINYGANVKAGPDLSTTETANEILLGVTDRQLSIDLYAAVEKEAANVALVWAIAERDGKVAVVANNAEAFELAKEDFLAFATDNGFSIPTGYCNISVITQEQIDAEIEAARNKRIEWLKNEIASFEYSQFGDAPTTSMTGANYGKPALSPTEGDHPRVNVTSYMLPTIREYMASDEAKYTTEQFWAMANTEYDGILPEATEHKSGRIGVHNMDEAGLAIIEAKAFAYLITGDELYAYEAIYAMKNFLVTIDIQHIHSDQCREFGRIMYCTAEVYDWCYDLLSEEDKAQFIMACADIGSSKNQNTDFGNQMEVGFPPRLQGCVSGHGSEHQVLRDYLSISIAIYDEDPTWYEWVGGMVYNYFVPFRDYYFASGTYPQGMNTYAPHRFDADLWSAWLLLCATGEIPYSLDFAKVTQSFFQNEGPDGSFFGTGDGGRKANASAFWHHATISSALYGDSTLRAQMMYFTKNMKKYTANSMSFSYAQMLILSARYYEVAETPIPTDRFEGFDPVCYFGSPLGQMTVREAWNDSDCGATLMKLGERSTANHEHADAGTFHIFYKGLYTGDSGQYDKYGSTHWTYYHTQTVAHNGLLIVNPSRVGNDPNNLASYFYSGGQRKLSEANNLDVWLGSSYDTGTVTGVQWEYKDDGTTDYAYLGGDITAAYDPSTVSYVGRHMLTYYTGNEDAPMYLIVYDTITSAGADFKKTFLLHTTNEPTIDTENKTVESIESGGRLVLKSLLGGDTIEKFGGAGNAFFINGRNCSTLSGNEGKVWGRVDISTNTEALTHNLLNFMFVTDATSTLMLEPEVISADFMNGLVIDNLVVVFADSSNENNINPLNFTVEGRGLYRFLVLGMFEGTWNISVDGRSVAHSVSSHEGGMISFYAPAGEISINPGKDIAPVNGGRIIYNSFGGIIPDEAPLVYEIGVPVPLPTDIVNGNDIFVGWYTSPTYEPETKITEIVATEKGKFNVYAKYNGVAAKENYENISFSAQKTSANGVNYSGKDGSVFATVKDEKTGNSYLHVTRGTQDPQIDIGAQPKNYLYGQTKITLVIDLARDGATPLGSTCRARGQNGSSDTVPFFSTSTGGTVSLGGKKAIMTLSEVFQTLAVTMDFERGTITGYDGAGNVLATVDFTPPAASGVGTTLEWLTSLSTSVNWWIGSGETLLIDNFSVYAGEYIPAPVVLPEGYSPITYHTNGGAFLSATDKSYKEGEIKLLDPAITKGDDIFLGWYTTPDFQSGTKIVEISADTKGEVEVYAKWAGLVLKEDFEKVNVDFTEATKNIGKLESGGAGKPGCVYRTETTADGNTYLYWHRGTSDSQLKYFGNLGTSFPSKHVATFTVSLSTVEGETPMAFQFRVRSNDMTVPGGKNNSITIFSTDTSGNVKLGGSVTFAKLSSDEFTKIIVAMDFETNTLYAYSEDGTELASTSFELENYITWLENMNLPIYMYPAGGESMRFDDVTISLSPYAAPEEELPSTLGKISYITGGGKLPTGSPSYYTKGEALELPIPTKENSVFMGWYKDEAFTQPIVSIDADETENLVIYALWKTVMLNFEAKDHSINYDKPADAAMGTTGAAGLSMQAKGEDSGYRTLTDESGNTYLLWCKGDSDPQIMFSGNLAEKASGSKIITFSFTIASNEGSIMAINARMRTGYIDGNRREVSLFRITSGGSIILADKYDTSLGQLKDEFQTFGVVADFTTGMLYGYGADGTLVATTAMYLPADFATYDELYDALTGDIFGLYAGGTAKTTIRIKDIKIETSNTYAE